MGEPTRIECSQQPLRRRCEGNYEAECGRSSGQTTTALDSEPNRGSLLWSATIDDKHWHVNLDRANIRLERPMAKPKTPKFGITHKSDLILLKRVYNRICREQGIAEGSHRAAELRASAMTLISVGNLSEASLYEQLRRMEYPAGWVR